MVTLILLHWKIVLKSNCEYSVAKFCVCECNILIRKLKHWIINWKIAMTGKNKTIYTNV